MSEKDVKRPMFVTCAIIRKGTKYLITQRPLDGRSHAGKWEFPGGKLEFGESPRESLKREIYEEMGINVMVEDLIEISSTIYSEDLHVVLVAFRCIYVEGEIETKDINDYQWVGVDEINNYDVTEADKIFVEKLKHYSFFP